MPDQTPAQTLTAAAQALEDAANATLHEIRHGTYWQGLPPEEAWQRGITNAVGGRAGDFCALMSPDAAKACAEWLRATALDYDTNSKCGECHGSCCGPRTCDCITAALAVARALLGGPQ